MPKRKTHNPPRDCGECLDLHGEMICKKEPKCIYGHKLIPSFAHGVAVKGKG